MTTLTNLRARRHARLVGRRAVKYTAHGWPVAALAVPGRKRDCPCGSDCEAPHLVSKPVRTPDRAEQTWSTGHPWDIALVTADFDVVELPATSGAALHAQLATSCPTMTVWRGRRWYFITETGAIDTAQVAAAGGSLHTGIDSWVAAPPTRVPPDGLRYWVVSPSHTGWHPYRRVDAIDRVLLGPAPVIDSRERQRPRRLSGAAPEEIGGRERAMPRVARAPHGRRHDRRGSTMSLLLCRIRDVFGRMRFIVSVARPTRDKPVSRNRSARNE